MDIKNNYTPAFSGKYIIKGFPKSIKDVNSNLLQKFMTSNDIQQMEAHPLIDLFSDSQSYAEMMYLTNNDLKPFIKFRLNGKRTGFMDYLKNKSDYEKAFKCGKDSLSNFLIDLYQKSRQDLAEIFGKEEAKNIKVLDANEVLAAVNKNKFDFVEGIIYK